MKEIDIISMREAGIDQSRIDKLSDAIRRGSRSWSIHEKFFTKSGQWRKRGVRYSTTSSGATGNWLGGYRPPKYIPRSNTPEAFELEVAEA